MNPADTPKIVIDEQDLIEVIRRAYLQHKSRGEGIQQDTVMDLGLALADKLMERNGWDRSERGAFRDRMFDEA